MTDARLCAICLGAIYACTASTHAMATEPGSPHFFGETGISSLGHYFAPSMSLSPRLHVRAPIYLGTSARSETIESNTFNGLTLSDSASLVTDYYLGDSGFRITGGLSFGGYDLSGTVANPTLNGRTYIGTFGIDITQNQTVAPILAAGYQRDITQNWSVSAEVGAHLSSLSISATGQNQLNAADRAQFNADLQRVNDDLNGIRAIPFVSIGARFEF